MNKTKEKKCSSLKGGHSIGVGKMGLRRPIAGGIDGKIGRGGMDQWLKKNESTGRGETGSPFELEA